MKADDFVGYVGDSDLHDATVLRVEHAGDQACVTVRATSGRVLAIAFSGVATIVLRRGEGMTLYSLSEMRADPPQRRFVFVNWDDEDDATVEVTARGFTVRESRP